MRQHIDRNRDIAVVAVASLLATLPVWLPAFPPMTDLPQHAAQVSWLRQIRQGGFPYESSFYVNWFTPYLSGYLLVYALTPIVGVVAACKIVVSAAVASLPMATALVMTETGTDRRLALLTIPASYGFAYQWGLLNFLVAAPIGLAFLWLTFRQARQPSTGGSVALAGGLIALFFCHAMTCLFFGLVAGLVLTLNRPTLSDAVRRVLPLVFVVPVMIAWGGLTIENPQPRQPVLWDLDWFGTVQGYYGLEAEWTTPGGFGWGRVLGMLPRVFGVRQGVLPAAAAAVLFLIPWCAGARFSRSLKIWIPFVVCLVTLMEVPSTLFGVALTFQRFALFVLPLLLITVSVPPGGRWPRWVWPACTLVAAGWIGLAVANTARYDAEAAGFDEIMSRMEPGARALSLIVNRDSNATIAPSFVHFASWYAALAGGLVEPSFAEWHVQLVLFRPDAQPLARLSESFESHPRRFESGAFGSERYRYLIVRSFQDPSTWIRRGSGCSAHLVHQVNHWWLYEQSPIGVC